MSKKHKKQSLRPAARPEDKRIVPVTETLKKAVSMRGVGEDVDIGKLIRRQNAVARRSQHGVQPAFNPNITYSGNPTRHDNLKSFFADPLALETNYYGTVRTISPYYGRQISHRILRRVSEKGWILNLCIQHLVKKIRPFLKESSKDNQHGFKITNTDAKQKTRGMTEAEKKEARRLVQFFMKTGDAEDDNREDDLDKYATKIVRDLLQLDQISTELQRTRGGDLCAFWAVDTATIEVALPESERVTGIKYAQVINHLPYAYYERDELIFDCMNPRTDIEKAGYGYSIVEQTIDLVTSAINTFMYNSGFFTENKLPRGILLLNGDADTTEVEDIEDYIANLMSGPPTSQWRVPIIPSGKDKNAESGGRRFEWVNLQGTNKEMEFQGWFDLLMSAVVAMFALSMEELGLHSQKSQSIYAENTQPKIEASKSLSLGDILGFLQKHFNKILSYKNPAYEFEFVGYEKDDPKLMLDLDKGEVETYKTIDEKRAEKGLDPFNETWSKVPLNPQVTQMVMGEQQGSPFGEDMGEMEGGEDEDVDAEGEGVADGSGWDDIEGQQDGEGEKVEKSLAGKRDVVRVAI